MARLNSSVIIARSLISAAFVALSACSSSNDGAADPMDKNNDGVADPLDSVVVSNIGLINVEDPLPDASGINISTIFPEINGTTGNPGEMLMFFFEASQPATAASIKSDYVEEYQPISDSCQIAIDTPESEDVLSSGFAELMLNPVGAGEVITVRSEAGSFAEIRKVPEMGPLVYARVTPATDAFPAGLIVDIPGADFPAVSAIAVPAVAPLILTSHASGAKVNVNQEITWQPGTNPLARISLQSFIDEGDNGALSSRVEIDCILVDDGSFAFRAAVQSDLANAGFSELPVSIVREVLSIHQDGDTLIFVTHSNGD